eukprot:CAMPEP_0203754062 /NCGR_PEP_ID=MMETSP0098-20131031/7719_1 /ASSEMBLY_ACC=CAM_ASM_000208 /TAXON_ID=96639 /ORGANISM=" , Strain NY0313808BC1" /LENGTH=1227 /DNA_ID=CAMNT_0050644915 /DNA_START=80 /DNA_END=3760 /DNA_ORIENTATION=+
MVSSKVDVLPNGADEIWDGDKEAAGFGNERDGDDLILGGHGGDVVEVAIDGGTIVTADSLKVIRAWERDTGRCVWSHQSTEYVRCVDIGQKVVVTATEKMIDLWDRFSWKHLRSIKTVVSTVGIDGDIVVSAHYGLKMVRVWDACTGECTQVLEGHSSEVSAVAIEGAVIASSTGLGKTVRVWDALTGACRLTIRLEEQGAIRSVAIKGNIVAFSCEDSITLWDIRKNKLHQNFPRVGESTFGSVAIGNDIIVGGTTCGKLIVFDRMSNKCIDSYNNNYWRQGWRSRRVSVCDRTIVSSGEETKAIVYNLGNLRTSGISELEESPEDCSCLGIDNNNVVTGSIGGGCKPGVIRVWDRDSGKIIQTIEGFSLAVQSVDVRNNRIISWGFNADMVFEDEKAAKTCFGYGIFQSPIDRIRVWDLKSGECVQRISDLEQKEDATIQSFACTESMVACGTKDGRIKAFSLKDGASRGIYTQNEHKQAVTSVAIRGDRIISGCRDHTLMNTTMNWQAESPQNSHILQADTMQDTRVLSIAFDHEFIISGGEDKLVRIWNLDLLNKCYSTLKGHSSSVTYVAIDGCIIVSASLDYSIRVWQWGRTSSAAKVKYVIPVTAIPKVAINQGDLVWSEGKKIYVAENALHGTRSIPGWVAERLIASNARKGYGVDLSKQAPSKYSAQLLRKVIAENTTDLPMPWPLYIAPHLVLQQAIQSNQREDIEYWTNQIGTCMGVPGEHWHIEYTTTHRDGDLARVLAQLVQKYPSTAVKLFNSMKFFSSTEPCPITEHDFESRPFEVRCHENRSTVGVWDNTGNKEKAGKRQRVEALVHPIPKVCRKFENRKPGEPASLLEAIVQANDVAFFSNLAIQTIVEFKWNSSGRKEFVKELSLYLFDLVLLFLLMFLFPDKAWMGSFDVTSFLVSLLRIYPLFRFARKEFHQWDEIGASRYFKDFFNSVEVAHTLLGMGLSVCLIVSIHWSRAILAIALYVKCFGVLYYLQAFRTTGAFVSMFRSIIYDMRHFLVVLSLAYLATTCSFHVLLRDQGVGGHKTFVESLFTMFNMLLLGDFDTGEFSDNSLKWLLRLLFVLSMIFIPIVLLNTLIALMSDSYERIKDEASSQYEMLRAKILVDQELLITVDSNAKDWLHVLVPEGGNKPLVESVEWQGVLHSINSKNEETSKELKSLIEKGEEQSKSRDKASQKRIDQLDQETKKRDEDSQNRIANLEEKLDSVSNQVE